MHVGVAAYVGFVHRVDLIDQALTNEEILEEKERRRSRCWIGEKHSLDAKEHERFVERVLAPNSFAICQ